jgi:hypothetical protein
MKKKTKNSFGIYLTEFAGSTQNDKKLLEHTKSTNQNENFLKKKYF